MIPLIFSPSNSILWMPSNIQNNLKLLKLVFSKLLSKTPMQIVTLLLLIFRIHGVFVARVISRHRKMYIWCCSVHVCKPARCTFNDGVNLLHHNLKDDLIIKCIHVEMCVGMFHSCGFGSSARLSSIGDLPWPHLIWFACQRELCNWHLCRTKKDQLMEKKGFCVELCV